MATVTFKGASRIYPGSDRAAVANLDLEIGDGEFLVLVGPSGCGKSTTLRMLAGLEGVDGGSVWIGDSDVTHLAPSKRDIAMVFQNYALYPHMTVADNIGFHLKIVKVPKAEIRRSGRGRRQGARPRGVPRSQAGQAQRRSAPTRGDGPRDRAGAAGVPDG